MNRLIVFIITMVLYFVIIHFSTGSVGASLQCVGDQCVVSASSSIFSIIFGLLLAGFALLFKRNDNMSDSMNVVGVWRRYGAFVVDFSAVLLVFSPVLSLPILIAEADHTGDFRWSFYRNFARDSDLIFLLPSIMGMLICLLTYFYEYSKSESQTLGEYIAGYKIIPVNREEPPSHMKRVFYSFFGLGLWPYSVYMALHRETKQFWWDDSCNTQAVRVQASNNGSN